MVLSGIWTNLEPTAQSFYAIGTISLLEMAKY